jgi:hypothetical protein
MIKDETYKFDKRTLDRKLKSNEFSEAEYKSYLESLPEITEYDEIDEKQIATKLGIKYMATLTENPENKE